MFFEQAIPVGNGPRRNATLIRARVLELVPGAWRTESLIGIGIPGGKLDKKWQINFSPAYLFNTITTDVVYPYPTVHEFTFNS